MKNVKLLSLLITVIVCFSGNTYAERGTEGGGGGNSIAAEFVYVGRESLSLVKEMFPELDLRSSEVILKNTRVFAVEGVCVVDENTGQDVCLDAYYFAATRRIEFDRNLWNRKSCLEKLVIASHEYLRAGGVEDANYYYSNYFLSYGSGRIHYGRIASVCSHLAYIQGVRRDAQENDRKSN